MLTHIKTSFVKSRLRLLIKIEKICGWKSVGFLGPAVGRPINANPGSSFNLGFIVFCLKAFSRTRASVFLEHPIMHFIAKTNQTEFSF